MAGTSTSTSQSYVATTLLSVASPASTAALGEGVVSKTSLLQY